MFVRFKLLSGYLICPLYLFRLNVDIFYSENQRYNALSTSKWLCFLEQHTHICQIESVITINGKTFKTNIVLTKTRFWTIEYRLPHP